LADRIAAWFVPAVFVVAIAAFVGWSLWGPEPRLAHALVSAVSVVIIACPCALGLATPMAIMVGTGRGASEGVLVRHAEALERLGRAHTPVLDQTGTLTAGRPRVVSVAVAPATVSEDDLLRAAAAVEQGSEHPMASAVLAAAKQRALTWTPAEEFESISGKGVRARVGGQDVILGNRALLEERRVDLRGTPAVATAEPLSSTRIHGAIGGRVAGAIAIADPINAGAREALDALRAEGLRIVMLTGDVQETAVAVGRALGIARDDVHAGVLPANKRDVV